MVGIDARVVDPETGREAYEGELWVRGPNVTQGYYGRERWQCFDAEGWLHTGDMMRVDEDGDLFFQGRSGDIIRTSGAQVSPREVEAAVEHAERRLSSRRASSLLEASINRNRTNARMISIFTFTACGLRRTLDSIATPCSVKARGKYLECSPLFKVPIWYLKDSYSSFVSSNMKSDGKRPRLRWTAWFNAFVSTP